MNVLETARLGWKNPTTPVSEQFDDVYFSIEDGYAESEFVFLRHNQLEDRFRQLANSGKQHFCIAETGFGTGLNFLLTCKLWQQLKITDKKLYFISTEAYPLAHQDLDQAHQNWPDLNHFSEQLSTHYPEPIRGMHTLEFSHGITLILIFDDATNGFNQLRQNTHPITQTHPTRAVDAWFLDGFAPSKNDSMWKPELFEAIAALSHRSTSFASFTAAGAVRRGLQQQGFSVRKTPGFGKKREMIIGKFEGLPQTYIDTKPGLPPKRYGDFWPIDLSNKPVQSVAVIGAGIAGSTTAKCLSEAGIKVLWFDKEDAPHQLTSGNPQAVLFPKLSANESEFAQFNLASFLYALRYYRQSSLKHSFRDCGVLQLLDKPDDKKWQQLIQHYTALPNFQRFVDSNEASQIACTRLEHNGIFYPQSGWIDTQALSQCYLGLPNTEYHFNTEVTDIERHDATWHIHTQKEKYLCDAVILCCGFASSTFVPDIKPYTNIIRGQVSYATQNPSNSVKTVVCHDGYLSPPANPNAPITFGASYDLNQYNEELLESSHNWNVDRLEAYLPDCNIEKNTLQGRVGFRFASTDYMPIIGPVANTAVFEQDYALLQRSAKAYIPKPGNYIPGLYLNTAYGSRAFSSAPLGAALIRSHLLKQPWPLPGKTIQNLSPARFNIKSLKQKNKN